MVTPVGNKVEPSEGDLEVGYKVGEYELTGKLGAGGFGTVYSALHPLIGKKAAVKVLSHEFSVNPEMVSRFMAEARAANTIRHANIIDIFNFGTLEDGRRYFVMELLDGVSLDAYFEEHAPLEPALVLMLMRGVARALDAAHEHGIVHRDLKPDNIFVTFDDDNKPQPKLLDFGIAKLLGDAKAISGHKTRTGSPVGTPSYMAPEQCLGEAVDEAVDVYAFGMVCFEGLTGRPPFTGKSFLELMNKQTSAERPKASEVNPALSPAFDEPLRGMMAIDKTARPPSVGEAYALLSKAADSAGIKTEVAVPKGTLKVRSENVGNSSDTYAQAAATMQADTLGSSTMGARAGRRTGLLVLAAVLVVGVALYAATARLTADTGTTPAEADRSAEVLPAGAPSRAEAEPTAPPVTTSSASAAPSASAVAPTFRVELAPNIPNAQVLLDGKEIGAPPGPFDIPADGKPHSVTVKAPRYQPFMVKRVIEAGATIEVSLKPMPSVSPDLENPF